MNTQLDAPVHSLDEHERGFVEAIREHGWFRTDVMADAEGPGFSYTTGLWQGLQHPELIVFGLNGQTAHEIFWDVFRSIEAGEALPIGRPVADVFGNALAYVLPVAEKYHAEYLGWSRWFYRGDGFPCVQIIWPDPEGRFPWNADFDPELKGFQPDLTELGWVQTVGGEGGAVRWRGA